MGDWSVSDTISILSLLVLIGLAWGTYRQRQGANQAATAGELAAFEERLQTCEHCADELSRQFNNLDEWPHGLMVRLGQTFITRQECGRRIEELHILPPKVSKDLQRGQGQ